MRSPGACQLWREAAADGTFPIVEYTATGAHGLDGAGCCRTMCGWLLPAITAQSGPAGRQSGVDLVHVSDCRASLMGRDVSAFLKNAAPARVIDADFDHSGTSKSSSPGRPLSMVSGMSRAERRRGG